jgi:hypothetical protein
MVLSFILAAVAFPSLSCTAACTRLRVEAVAVSCKLLFFNVIDLSKTRTFGENTG